MKKLIVAVPVLGLLAGGVVSSCSSNDQGTTITTGSGGGTSAGTGGSASPTGNGGSGPSTGEGGSAATGGSSNATGNGGSLGTGGGASQPDSSAGGAGGSSSGTGGAPPGTGGGAGGPMGGSTGTGGTPPRPDAGGTGTGGSAGGDDAGGGGDLLGVAAPLNGFMLKGPCLGDTAFNVCSTANGACPNQTGDTALQGVRTTDTPLTLGGTTGQMYNITIHVQGEVEAKGYNGTRDISSAGAATAALNGFAVGGVPTTADFYNVYMIRVTNPGSTTPTDYFLNSVVPPGTSNHTTYTIDYTATFQAMGGAALRMVAADRNCSMIKNCGPNGLANCNTPIIVANIEPTARTLNPTFNFTTAYNGQFVVITVKAVCMPGSAGCLPPS